MLESEIEQLEKEISDMEATMSKPEVYANIERLSEATRHYELLKSNLKDKNLSWGQTIEEIFFFTFQVTF